MKVMNPFRQSAAQAASFLPEDYVAKKAETRANFIALTLFAMVMFLVVAAFFVTNRRWVTIRAEQAAINRAYQEEAAKIEQLKALEKQERQMAAKAEITTALLERVPRSILFSQLEGRMPAGVYMLELEIKSKRIDPAKEAAAAAQAKGGKTPPAPGKIKSLAPGGAGVAAQPAEAQEVRPPRFEHTMTLTGVAEANPAVTDYLSKLKQCGLLEAVELNYIKESKIKNSEYRKFEITARIRTDVDAQAWMASEKQRAAVATAGEPAAGEK